MRADTLVSKMTRLLNARLLTATLVVTPMLLGMQACGPGPNSLDGSIGEVVDLTFDQVQMRQFTSGTIQLDYLRSIEDTEDFDIVCKVVFDIPEGGINVDTPIDIPANNGRIERVVVAQYAFPEIYTANITFTSGGDAPGPVVGEFGATFEGGRTLEGTFDTDLEEIDF